MVNKQKHVSCPCALSFMSHESCTHACLPGQFQRPDLSTTTHSRPYSDSHILAS